MSQAAARFRVPQSAQEREWNAVLAQIAQHDFYHLVGYHRLAEERGEGSAHLFAYHDGAYTIALPLLLRPVEASGGEAWSDVVQPDAVIGDHVIVNTGATIDHDCTIGDYAHLAPGVHLSGSVHVGEGAFLGIGSVVIPGVKIGRWSTLGAGAVAIRDLADGVTAVGVPARVLKR